MKKTSTDYSKRVSALAKLDNYLKARDEQRKNKKKTK